MSDERDETIFSERDLDLRQAGIKSLALLEILVEGEDEDREEELIEQLVRLTHEIQKNGVTDVESLDFFSSNELEHVTELTAHLNRNPKHLYEYIAGLARFVAVDYLESKRINLHDFHFDVTDPNKEYSLENTDAVVLTNEDINDAHANFLAVRMMIAGAIEYLEVENFIATNELETVKQKILES